jgi:DNA-binding MarR family transcriptional regulator
VKISPPPTDHVERVRAQWASECPDLDTLPLAVVARVGRLARYFDQRLDRLLAEHDLRRESWDVLASLRRSGRPYRLSPTDLYLGLMRTSGAMTNRLHRLERAGLVSRVDDTADGRGRLVELTERGRRLVDALAPTHMANEAAMLAALSPEEQHTLAGLLAKLLAALEAQEGQPPRGNVRRRRCRSRQA